MDEKRLETIRALIEGNTLAADPGALGRVWTAMGDLLAKVEWLRAVVKVVAEYRQIEEEMAEQRIWHYVDAEGNTLAWDVVEAHLHRECDCAERLDAALQAAGPLEEVSDA